MAAGSSAPEFIAEMVGVIMGEESSATGTVVGSAVFNQLFIIGAAILVSPNQMITLDKHALCRDLIAYGITIAVVFVSATTTPCGLHAKAPTF